MKTVVSRDVKFKKGFASRKSHEPIPMTKDEEQEAPKVELGSLSTSKALQQPSHKEEERLAPSTFINRPQWFTQR